MVLEPQHPPLAAVPGQTPAAPVARPTADVNLPHHPLPPPGGILGAGYLSQEFVAHDPPKVMIAPEDLQVGAADAGQTHPDENLTGAGFGPGDFPKGWLSVKVEGKHNIQ
jgi:hypothetical protein